MSRLPLPGFFKTYADPGVDLQVPSDVAVVIASVLRPSLRASLASIFTQDFTGKVHILLGIDKPMHDLASLDALAAGRPANCILQVFYPGYSTSARHGGVTGSVDGGALRCLLSHLANSTAVAYLDDDNWWRPDHLRLMREALNSADWAFTLRWFAHPTTLRPICVDEWESVGPGRGVFADQSNGFVDPNCLMLNRVTCQSILHLWCVPLSDDPSRSTADRSVFNALATRFRGAGIGKATVFYRLNPSDGRHAMRVRALGAAYEQAGRAV